MLTLNDGRSELWQWDTGRTLAVDADCSQVHFSNKVFGRSIDVDVVGGTAIIPDVLLQTDKYLTVWAFVGTAENGYTKISKTFKVNRRNKPADYVFTPVEQTTIAEIAAIAKSVRDDADAGLFNGPQGPSGPAGDDGKTPEYGVDYGTPEQIAGIAQQAADILQPEFNQLKDELENKVLKSDYAPEAKTDAMTQPVGKDADGKLWTAPGSGGGGIAVSGATVGQTVKISAVDDDGVPTAWEPVDLPSGESVEVKEWEEFMRFTVDNSETTVFDFSSNGDETLKSKKVKEFYIYSPSMGDTGCGTASVLVNDYVKITSLTGFGRSAAGSCKLALIANSDTLDVWYFGRDTEGNLAAPTPNYLNAVETDGVFVASLASKIAYKKLYSVQNGVPFPNLRVDYIKTVVVTVSEACSAGVEFIVYVR